jgi:hypothetical protein
MNPPKPRPTGSPIVHARLAIFFLGALLVVPPAYACRQKIPEPTHLAKFNLVVLASVQTSEHTGDPNPNVWKITAEGARTIAGKAEPVSYTFTTYIYSEGCWGIALPAKGERWVLYLEPKQPSQVVDALPLELVRAYDQRLKNIH